MSDSQQADDRANQQRQDAARADRDAADIHRRQADKEQNS